MEPMRNFALYLNEAYESTEEKLRHLEHVPDHLLVGEAGFHHAFNTLKTTAETLQGHDTGTRIMTKYDGAPSVVFGRNPENGKFFVASKSAFNKNPKINYTAADIERNHGHAPGLVSKLKAALEHLPKVTPRHGVFQGDFLYNKADGDVQETDNAYVFKPQLIEHTAKKNSAQGQAIARAQIGFAVHTGYRGTSLDNMKADYTPDLKNFVRHPDVHVHRWDQSFDVKKANYTEAEHEQFKTHMNKAGEIFRDSHRGKLFSLVHTPGLNDHVQTYLNKTVRQGDNPSVTGLREHIAGRYQKELDRLKTPKAQQNKRNQMHADISAVNDQEQHLKRFLELHRHLQAAKHSLVPALQRGDATGYAYSINNQPSVAEGHVVVTAENRPSKIIDQRPGGFSQQNLQKGGFGK
jgi:hypothetical protein